MNNGFRYFFKIEMIFLKHEVVSPLVPHRQTIAFKMSGFYPQETDTATKILTEFTKIQYVILFAQMQSGKSNTFKLVACEMLRRSLIGRVVIFSGNREMQLTDQLRDHTKFQTAYSAYLQSQQGLTEDEATECAKQMLHAERFIILGGQDLLKRKKFEPNEDTTLYIWEESHYGQSKRQQVDKFLDLAGINANGENLRGNFVLSVSATPFSELSDFYNLDQPKVVVQLFPAENYLGVQQLKQTGRMVKIFSPEKTLRRILPTFGQCGYGLIRASDKNQEHLSVVAASLGWDIVKFDQTSGAKDINKDILDIVPTNPTIVFLKGMCRMGKEIHKQHILFGMETSKSKTDTLLQGLVGRWCGYTSHPFNASIYVLDFREIEDYIALWGGDAKCIPRLAANMKRGNTSSILPIIPCRIRVDTSDPDFEIADTVLNSLDDGSFENLNTGDETAKIIENIRAICDARRTRPSLRTEGQKTLSKQCKVINSEKSNFTEKFEILKDAFQDKERKQLGSEWGTTSRNNVLIIVQGRGEVFLYMSIVSNDQLLAPSTNKREVFCKPTVKTDEDGYWSAEESQEE